MTTSIRTLAVLIISLLAAYAEDANSLSNGAFSQQLDNWETYADSTKATLNASVESENFKDIKKALSLDVEVYPAAKPWDASLQQLLTGSFTEQESIVIEFWAKSITPEAKFQVGIQDRKTFDKACLISVLPSKEWKLYHFTVTSKIAISEGEAMLVFHLAHKSQVINLASIRVGPEIKTDKAITGNILANGDFISDMDAWDFVKTDGIDGDYRSSIIPIEGKSFAKALHVSITKADGLNPWDIQIHQKLATKITERETVLLSFWARAENEGAKLDFAIQGQGPDYKKAILIAVELSTEWKFYEFESPSLLTLEKGEADFYIHLAHRSDVFEIADVKVSQK